MKSELFINLSDIDEGEFRISKRIHPVAGEIYLITPGFDKHIWNENDVHLRSLILDPTGKIISSGLPKFFNYGEDQNNDQLTRRLIAEGRVFFTEKMDGSLIIRDVINNQVCFRTRGSHEVGEEFDEVMELVRNQYPNLLNPDLFSDVTLLFEYTSPNNQIILKYEVASLTALGMMVYDHPSRLPVFKADDILIDKLASTFGVNPVKIHHLPLNLDEAAKIIRSWSGSEGIVVWGELPDDRIHLVKIKTEEYIRLHSLKYHLSGDKIKRLCWWKNIETHDQLRDEMYRLGVDWEFISFILPDFEEYLARKNWMLLRIERVKREILDARIHQLGSAKHQAEALKGLYASDKQSFNIGIQFCRGNENYLKRMIDAYALDVSLNSLNALEERIREEFQLYGF